GLVKANAMGVSILLANEPTVTGASSTAITARYNSADVWTDLDDRMPNVSSELKVTSTAGFADGQRVLIWDDSGTYDWLIITHVQDDAIHLQHNTTDCSKSYDPDDNAMVALVEEVSFRY